MISSSTCLLIVAVTVHVFGYYVFYCGFLPNPSDGTSSLSSGDATTSTESAEGREFVQSIPRKFDRLIIVLVDALRADFVYNFREGKTFMPFLQEKLVSNKSFSYISVASLPTVTMPRIKGITSGSIPSFYEMLVNAVSNEYTKDNIIERFHDKGMSMVFYGDETWIRLFPNKFKRSDGTDSFYVTDYTEVDDNVTRHIDFELASQDWNVMILHYLGLDHIGHTVGPYSPLIGKKLLEMDKLIEKIYKEMVKGDDLKNQSTLLLITGDHGMSNAGSHGGASREELNTPVVLLTSTKEGKNFNNTYVKQTDIAVTLSILLGTKIPSQSIGKPLPILKNLYNYQELELIYQVAACQLHNVMPQNFHVTESKELLRDLCFGLHKNIEIVDIVSQQLHAMSSDYDDYKMVIGIFVMILPCFILIPLFKKDLGIRHDKSFILNQKSGKKTDLFNFFWILMFLLSLASSSLIEEEQYLYYFSMPSFFFLLVVCHGRDIGSHIIFLLLVVLRVMRSWNRTGVKWCGIKDIEDFLNLNPSSLIAALLTGFCIFLWIMKIHLKKLIFGSSVIALLWYKCCSCEALPLLMCSKTSQIYTAKAIYILLLINLLLHKGNIGTLKTTWMVLCLLLLRSTNFPWFCIVIVADHLLTNHLIPKLIHYKFVNVWSLIFIYFGLSRFSHFAQGNSNNFATVDIAAGVIGFSEFHPVWSILVSFLATYCTKLFWDLSFLGLIKKQKPMLGSIIATVICIYQMIETSTYCVVVFLMRYHLFIWSVFAPKYFYLISQSLLNLLIVVPTFFLVSNI